MKRLSSSQRKDLYLFIWPLCIYLINEAVKNRIFIPVLGYFLRCHFNDLLGGVSFAAYVNFILSLSNWTTFRFVKLTHVIIEGVCCGIVWELITPLFLDTSTGDFWDVVAYVAGMIIYWFLAVRLQAPISDKLEKYK